MLAFARIVAALAVVAPLGMPAAPIAAQTVEAGGARAGSSRGFLSVGLGGGTGSKIAFLGALTGGNARHGVVLRGVATEELAIFGPRPHERDWDIGVLYSRRFEDAGGAWTAISAGPAVAGGQRKTDRLLSNGLWEAFDYKVLGLALQAEGVLTVGSRFGLGLTGFANVNLEYPFGGGMLSFHLGPQR